MIRKKILSFLSISILSFFCFACAMQHKTVSPTVRSEMLNDLKEGRMTLRCKLDCDWTWLQNYPSMTKLHNLAMWEDLAVLVMQIGLENGPSYFFLGKAADGLAYYDAAIKYYNYSLALYRDPNALNHCKGRERPGFCGDVDYEYEIPLLIGDATKKRDALLHPVATAPAPPPKPEAPPKKKPDPTVKAAQEDLVRLGFDIGLPDGLMGKMTREAIRQFQEVNNIESTGKLDSETLSLLKSSTAKGNPSQGTESGKRLPGTVEGGSQRVEETDQPPPSSLTGPSGEQQTGPKGSQKTITEVVTGGTTPPPPPPPTVIGHGTVIGPAEALAKPKVSADVVASIPNETRVDILGQEGDFYKISYQGKEVYINSMFISK